MDMDDLRVVKSTARVVGSMGFEGGRLEVKDKQTGEIYTQPCLLLATNMMSGEQNKPLVLTSELIMPLIANLSAWAMEVTQMVMDGTMAVPVNAPLDPVNDVKRLPGETWQEWQDRLMRIARDKQADEDEARRKEREHNADLSAP